MESTRYRVERPLGRGGMGTVFLSRDEVLDRLVALKRARRASAVDLLRFKREFRAIEGLTHEHLVRLYELGADADGLYFTMEAIDGVGLDAWCRAGDAIDRLRALLPQLIDALSFLHAHGVVHCDLKPSNLLVRADGTLKVLDFGVLAELSAAEDGSIVGGTPGYIAPERIRGEPATPATDAYALGCTLFEIATGRRPFVGSAKEVLRGHLSDPSPRASSIAPVPLWLDEACAALLAKDPTDRMTLAELSARVPEARPAVRVEPARTLLGRDTLAAELERRLEEVRPLVLAGPSGVGKSSLVEVLARRASERGLLVLRSASRSTERIAFNALDAAMDDLARELMRADRSVDRRALRVAAEAFPVLRASSRSIDDAREQVRQRLFGFREQLESCTRRAVFDAVAKVVEQASIERGALLLVDDFQWADGDSVALLSHLLEHVGPALRVGLVLRDDVERGLAHDWLETSTDAVTVGVPPLDVEDTARLVRRIAEQRGAQLDDHVIEEAARACGGRPYLAEVAGRALARGAGPTPDEVLDAAWSSDGELLALVAIVDGWTDVATLARMLDRPLGELDEVLARLEIDGLVRRSGTAIDRRIDVYHDRVRTGALARLSPDERSRQHARIADRLLADGAQSHRVVPHLLASARTAEAARHAILAAAHAERQRAFGLAADMYAVALAHGPDDDAVRESRAWALERSSRYAEAAAEWATLGATASGERRLDLALHEAHALIAACRTVEGIGRLESALARAGRGSVRVRGLRAIATAARFVLGPVRGRRDVRADPGRRARAERDLKIGILLSFLDPLTGMSFLQRARTDLVRAGADAQVAGCDYMLGILALAGSRDPERVALADRYLHAARARSQGIDLPPDVRGMEPFALGLRGMRRGAWRDARARFDEAAAIFRESVGTTEVTMARSWQMMMAAHAQDMREVRRHRDWFRRHAAECGGTLLVTHLALVDGYIQLLEGRIEEAFDTVTRGAAHFDADATNAQRAALLVYRHGVDVYRDPLRARRELAADFAEARPYRFMSTMYAGTYGAVLALIEANALRAGDRGASSRRIERLARIIDASPPLWAGSSWRVRAYVADAEGRPELAIEHLARAEREAARFERHVDVAIARWQRGRRIGGDRGAALCADATSRVESLGVSPRVLEEDVGLR